MSQLMRKVRNSLLVSTLLPITMAPVPAEGGREGGGGQNRSAEFVQFARHALNAIRMELVSDNRQFESFNDKAIEHAINTTEVLSIPASCLKPVSKLNKNNASPCLDARYIADKNRIEFSSESWPSKTCLEKMIITMHEYGRAAGVENGAYQLSSKLGLSNNIKSYCEKLTSGGNSIDHRVEMPWFRVRTYFVNEISVIDLLGRELSNGELILLAAENRDHWVVFAHLSRIDRIKLYSQTNFFKTSTTLQLRNGTETAIVLTTGSTFSNPEVSMIIDQDVFQRAKFEADLSFDNDHTSPFIEFSVNFPLYVRYRLHLLPSDGGSSARAKPVESRTRAAAGQ